MSSVVSGAVSAAQGTGGGSDPLMESIANLFSSHAIWLVPLLLVVVQFVLKLFVAEEASLHQTWKNFLQSPVDVGFLALSFAATMMMTNPSSIGGILAAVLFFVLLIVISIVIWKCSPTHTTKSSLLISSVLVVINFLITGSMLVYSISIML